MTERVQMPTFDELDRLVDADPIRLRDWAWLLVREVERLKAELASTVELGEQVIRAEARAVRELEAEVAALRGSCVDEATSPPSAFTDALSTAHVAEEGS